MSEEKPAPTASKPSSSVFESPEFHDPYSELNLFLSQMVKQEMRHCSNSKKWSVKLQDQLTSKIAPEFEKRFPRYRLEVSALKKTWEKVFYYSTQIQDQKEALTQEGKLNIPFLIKENLRHLGHTKSICQLHPYHYAHQLALKMSQCIAVVDGTRPRVDELAQTIWSIHRHLIPQLEPLKSPYDHYDKVDQWLVKKILMLTAKQPQIGQVELSTRLEEQIEKTREFFSTFTNEQIKKLTLAFCFEKSGTASHEPLLTSLSFSFAQLLEAEVAQALIDHPEKPLHLIAETASRALEQQRTLLARDDLSPARMQIWTQQSDLLCRWISLRSQSSLFKLTSEKAKVLKGEPHLSKETLVADIATAYFSQTPALVPYGQIVLERIWTFLKTLWYTHCTDGEMATFHRFLLWHGFLLQERAPELSPEELIAKLKELCQNMLPLVPFDADRAFALLYQHQT
jgi:hypothetical protein